MLQTSSSPSTTPKHRSFLASGGIAVVVLLVVLPVLLIACLMICRWRPRQSARQNLNTSTAVTVIVPPPSIDSLPLPVLVGDKPEFYEIVLQRLPSNRPVPWSELTPLSVASTTPLTSSSSDERPTTSGRPRSSRRRRPPSRLSYWHLSPQPPQSVDAVELSIFPPRSLSELGVAVAIVLPRQPPEFVQGRAHTHIPLRPVDVCIGFTRIPMNSR